MNDRRRPRVPARPKAAPQLTGPVQLDDETRNALILFNARLVAQDELEREKRRVDKASKAKDEAAAKVRQLENDPKATGEQKAEAQAGYLAALDALNRAKAGEPLPADAVDATDDEPADEPADDAVDEAAAADEPAAVDEPAAADEPAAVDDAPEPAAEPAAADAPEPEPETAADEPVDAPEPAAADEPDASTVE